MLESQIVRIKVNGVLLPTPSEINVSYEDLDSEDSTRNLIDGVLDRSVIRYGVMKIELVFLLNDRSNMAMIMNQIKPKHLNVELYDWMNQVIATKQMYAGPKKFGIVRANGKFKGQGLQFSLTER